VRRSRILPDHCRGPLRRCLHTTAAAPREQVVRPCIALKVDVDTLHGTRVGALRLAQTLEVNRAHATFLFSVGPDHTGRAIRRVLRPGFVGKVRRTSIVSHYGIRTLLYGVLLPGPHIGRRAGADMRAVARAGFEIGLHAYDHVRWQDGIEDADRDWAWREMASGVEAFVEVFGREPTVHGAAGWHVNAHVPELEREFGMRIASDTRGSGPFVPVIGGKVIDVPQLPTTLPTLDELLGRSDLSPAEPVEHLLSLTEDGAKDHVYTLHAEIEGGACIGHFESLLAGWRSQGYEFTSLGHLATRHSTRGFPRCEIGLGRVSGRAGPVAMQGAAIRSAHSTAA
jgi:peptidoglycan/xylan/chitin deacetylase (PgdA/CDA1 family)